jgi:hypothetical protein
VVTATNAPVNIALRPGANKLSFVRVDYDSHLGLWVAVTNRFRDQYVTNFTLRAQQLERTLPQPDILFTAQDIGPTPAGDQFFYGGSYRSRPRMR